EGRAQADQDRDPGRGRHRGPRGARGRRARDRRGSAQGPAWRAGRGRAVSFDIFIRRPVFTAVLSLLLILFGIVSLTLLSVRETPNVQAPIVTVTTVWFGADPALME